MFNKNWFLLFIGIFSLQFNIIESATSNVDNDDVLIISKKEESIDTLLEYLCEKYPILEEYLSNLFIQISQKNIKIYELDITIKELIAQMEMMKQPKLVEPKLSTLNPEAEPYRSKTEV